MESVFAFVCLPFTAAASFAAFEKLLTQAKHVHTSHDELFFFGLDVNASLCYLSFPSIHWDHILCRALVLLSSFLGNWTQSGRVATPTQDTRKLALILPTSEG